MRTQKTLLILFLFTGFNSFGQWEPFELSNGLFQYQKVVELPGQCQVDLYSKVKLWFSQSLSGGLVIQKESEGVLIGTGTGSISCGSGFNLVKERVIYTLTVEVKDDKIRYTYNNIMVKAEDASYCRRLEEYNQRPWIRKDGALRKSSENVKKGVLELLQASSKDLKGSVNTQVFAENW